MTSLRDRITSRAGNPVSVTSLTFVDTHGAPTFSDCADSTTLLAVVFTSEQSVIELTSVWRHRPTTSVQFQLTTNEPDALIMYSVGSATGASDFFGVELVQGASHSSFHLHTQRR